MRRDIPWLLLDWSRSNSSLARSLGATRDTVARYRKQLGLPPYGSKYRAADWDRSNSELAAELGVSTEAVRHARGRYGTAFRRWWYGRKRLTRET